MLAAIVGRLPRPFTACRRGRCDFTLGSRATPPIGALGACIDAPVGELERQLFSSRHAACRADQLTRRIAHQSETPRQHASIAQRGKELGFCQKPLSALEHEPLYRRIEPPGRLLQHPLLALGKPPQHLRRQPRREGRKAERLAMPERAERRMQPRLREIDPLPRRGEEIERPRQRSAGGTNPIAIGAGLPADRFKATGFGSSQPVADNSTDEGKAKNRRIDFLVR